MLKVSSFAAKLRFFCVISFISILAKEYNDCVCIFYALAFRFYEYLMVLLARRGESAVVILNNLTHLAISAKYIAATNTKLC